MKHRALILLNLLILSSCSLGIIAEIDSPKSSVVDEYIILAEDGLPIQMLERIKVACKSHTLDDNGETLLANDTTGTRQVALPHSTHIKSYTGQVVYILKQEPFACVQREYKVWVCSVYFCTAAGLTYTGRQEIVGALCPF
ncbi:MAG: hypothetical protein KBC36_04015 [Spirochaetia bacterium]|nr:hypothetical protein [Spirochaetia bacterium]